MKQDIDQRFWSKVLAQGVCWEWQATKQPQGHGYFWAGTRMVLAHRWSYERLLGPIPEGLTLDHLCRNTCCVNPDHLEPVTLAENVRRARSFMIGAAMQRSKMSCPSGHPLHGENLYVTPDNKRRCRVCRRESVRRSRAKRIVYRPGQASGLQLERLIHAAIWGDE